MNGDNSIRPNFGMFSDSDDNSNYIWVTDFDDAALQAFYSKFMRLESDPGVQLIPIFISSYGGDTTVLCAMRDMIKSSTKLVATIALGKAYSCGACLLAAGTKGYRFASQDSLVMIHQVSAGAIGKTSDITAEAESVALVNKVLIKNLAQDMGVKPEAIHAEIKNRSNTDWYLNSNEALKWGVIDHIGLPRVANQPSITGIMLTRAPKSAKAKKAPKAKKK